MAEQQGRSLIGKIRLSFEEVDASELLFQILGRKRDPERGLRIVRELDTFFDTDEFVSMVYDWSKAVLKKEGYDLS